MAATERSIGEQLLGAIRAKLVPGAVKDKLDTITSESLDEKEARYRELVKSGRADEALGIKRELEQHGRLSTDPPEEDPLDSLFSL